ncbi:dihydropteroate synthase [Corynebacterium freiburgense]|uniref:dihydropteroate synthase n=1 Tax=Corynebacterium freiburgense TaxID=556548 RepID=UPI00041B5436|nr:dihydropteroate synthase [Corynebacterium freiburgense]
MGILNITSDSFSDGGKWLDLDAAAAHAKEMVAQGADLIDVGGESTRPGAVRVDPNIELRRVVPVIQTLHQEGIVTSVDTMRASVAEAAVVAGASIINDVSGGLADPNMLRVMAETQATACLMHWETKQFGDASGSAHQTSNVVVDVIEGLKRLIERASKEGVEKLIVDPGLGFAKTPEDNWALLRALPEIAQLGYPVLVGASRKRFLEGSDAATAAVSALAAQAGAWGVRVHEIPANRAAVDIAWKWKGEYG